MEICCCCQFILETLRGFDSVPWLEGRKARVRITVAGNAKWIENTRERFSGRCRKRFWGAKMSRPIALVFILLILILTSQFEWKQQLVNELEPSAVLTKQQQQISNKKELIKEQIILSQEKKIQSLNELVKVLQQQLIECKEINLDNSTGSAVPFRMKSGMKKQDVPEE